jgi:NADH:ubiquinone oxidoreductase subunit E
MNQNKTVITVCLGSSCFSRGNKKTVQVIQQFLKHYHLEDQVIFRGAHCFNVCGEGPVVKVDEDILKQVDDELIVSYLKEKFGI